MNRHGNVLPSAEPFQAALPLPEPHSLQTTETIFSTLKDIGQIFVLLFLVSLTYVAGSGVLWCEKEICSSTTHKHTGLQPFTAGYTEFYVHTTSLSYCHVASRLMQHNVGINRSENQIVLYYLFFCVLVYLWSVIRCEAAQTVKWQLTWLPAHDTIYTQRLRLTINIL